MEDFIERVGQSYLERKAFGVPQQLENIAKKQLIGGGEKEVKGKEFAKEEEEGKGEEEQGERTVKKKGSRKMAGQISSGSLGKDKEIARLKRQLAQSKLESPKVSSGKSALGLKQLGIRRASNGQKAFTSKAAKGNKEKELAALGAAGVIGGRHERKGVGFEKEASGSKLAKVSSPKRRMSTSQHNEHDRADGSRNEHGGHAESSTTHAAAASEGKRRPSAASQSEHESPAKSIVPAPAQKHLPVHAERPREERAMVESRRSRRPNEQERDLCVIEVEEDMPRRRKDAGGVVEVESSKGKTLYRVK